MRIAFVTTDDWVAMYIDGELAIEGHSLHYTHVLDALGLAYEEPRHIECNHETEWVAFAGRIEDVKLHKYE